MAAWFVGARSTTISTICAVPIATRTIHTTATTTLAFVLFAAFNHDHDSVDASRSRTAGQLRIMTGFLRQRFPAY